MNRVELAVFDLAGTTVEDQGGLVAQALWQTAEAHGIETSLPELNSMMGLNKLEVYSTLIARQFPEAEVAVRAAGALSDFRQRMLATYARECKPIPGVEATFRFLKEHDCKVALNTGFDRPIAGQLLAQLGWLKAGLADLLVCVDDVPAGRPAPYMIFHAMMALGVQSVHRVIKVGDNPSDLLEGRNAGCLGVIGVLSGAADAVTLGRYPHTQLLPSVRELPELALQEGWIAP